MKHFLITTELPIKNGWVKTTFTITCKENMFGKKELSEAIIKAAKKVNTEIELHGKNIRVFAMEITKKQCDYYENH